MPETATPSSDDIAAIAGATAFGGRLVTNVHRGLIAEAIVSQALCGAWRWCSSDYAGWDFELADGSARLEVKQAASRQTWHASDGRPSRIEYDVRARAGRYEGAAWIESKRRWADVYIFAHHYVIDETADHRDPTQWAFYAVPTSALPDQKKLALSRIQSLVPACDFNALGRSVSRCLSR